MLPVPTVHLNGTSRAELLDGVTAAAQAIDRAMDKLADAWPNGRDYYPQEGNARERAAEWYTERALALRTIRDELMQIAEAISNGGHKS
jgi:hypothetical protein